MCEVPRAEQRIAVWPCDHGNVIVEPGPAKKEYRCSRCGATATTYVEAAAADRLADAITEALESAQVASTPHASQILRDALAGFSGSGGEE